MSDAPEVSDRMLIQVERLRSQKIEVKPHPTKANLIVLYDEMGKQVFVTTKGSTHVLMAGFQMYVPKPVEPVELAAVVCALAGRTKKD